MQWSERMRDSATPEGIPDSWTGAVAGYLSPGDPYRPWAPTDWARFSGRRKLPIYVQTEPQNNHPWTDADQVLRQLRSLGVPQGKYTVLDLDGAIDPAYVEGYGDAMHLAGYKTWVYGQASTLFANPPLNGYWVADYRGIGPYMYGGEHIRATQYASPQTGSGGNWDSSTLQEWVYWSDSWWR